MPEKQTKTVAHEYETREVAAGRFAVYDKTLSRYVSAVFDNKGDADKRRGELSKANG